MALLAIVFGIVPLCRAQGAPTWHKITGIVTSADGPRVSNACVYAWPIAGSGNAGHLGCTQTDKDGAFEITLPPGRYAIRAKSETDAYPDPNFLLCADPRSDFPEIVVDGSDITGLRVILGSRGGILEGDIRDELTQLPIVRAKVTISDARDPAAYVEIFSNKTGHFRFTVPGKRLSLSVTATGYKDKRIGDVSVANGERRSFAIELQPK